MKNLCFVDGPCPRCGPYDPDENCPECYGAGLVGWCEERVRTPRTETPWSKALAAALLRSEMTLGKASSLTGLKVHRISAIKNGEDKPTAEEAELLEKLLGFSG